MLDHHHDHTSHHESSHHTDPSSDAVPRQSHGETHGYSDAHHRGHGHHAHSHEHHADHGAAGAHDESSGHSHGHAHGHQQDDQWSGEEYLKYPGLRELAAFSHETVIYALKQAELSDSDIKALNVLEVGCGAGAVTQLYARSFASVHGIDVSPSMLSTFASELPSDEHPNVTHFQHTLSANTASELASGKLVLSPTKAEPHRQISLQRRQWNLAVVNLVLHHVDDIEGFMKGLQDVVEPGGWVVFTEFTNLHHDKKTTAEGSVNAPHHYHKEFNEQTITELLSGHGWTDIYTEVRGKMRISREGQFHDVDCLIARARNAAKDI